jgi:hypothetical protein
MAYFKDPQRGLVYFGALSDVSESPYGQVMLQNPYFTAPNPHMTSHQFNKSAKKKISSPTP